MLISKFICFAQLKNQGLSHVALHVISTAIVLSVDTYAFPLLKGDKVWLYSLFRKDFKTGFCFQTFSMEKLVSAADKNYFVKLLASTRHYLHSLLPKLRHSEAHNFLRSRGHNYQLPQLEFDLFKNSF